MSEQTPPGRTAAVAVGETLPTLAIDVTATVIVAGAIATRDFMPVHHDVDYARRQGAPDIFMNILSDTGHVSRYVTDWAGPEAQLTRLAIRLGVPVHPGDTLTFSGQVEAVEPDPAADQLVVTVQVAGTTHRGPHVTGSVTLTLPT